MESLAQRLKFDRVEREINSAMIVRKIEHVLIEFVGWRSVRRDP